jgi:hypothetical protein
MQCDPSGVQMFTHPQRTEIDGTDNVGVAIHGLARRRRRPCGRKPGVRRQLGSSELQYIDRSATIGTPLVHSTTARKTTPLMSGSAWMSTSRRAPAGTAMSWPHVR